MAVDARTLQSDSIPAEGHRALGQEDASGNENAYTKQILLKHATFRCSFYLYWPSYDQAGGRLAGVLVPWGYTLVCGAVYRLGWGFLVGWFRGWGSSGSLSLLMHAAA